MPQSEMPSGSDATRFSQSERFDARPGLSRIELLAEFAFGYRPGHGGSYPAEDVRHALTAYVTVAEWERVVDRIAAEGRNVVDEELLRLTSIVSAQLEGCRQRRLTAEIDALGIDSCLLGEWIYEAVADAYGNDREIYEGEGYRRTEHLEAAARRKVIARGYEAIADHPAVENLIAEEIDHIFELSAQATYVAFQGGDNGEELAMARAHSELLCPSETIRPTTIVRAATHRLHRQASARRSRGRAVRRRGSRRVSRSTGPPGDDSDPEPLARLGTYGLAGDRTLWDIAVTSFGALVGGGVMGSEGMLIGGVVAYLWGSYRWQR